MDARTTIKSLREASGKLCNLSRIDFLTKPLIYRGKNFFPKWDYEVEKKWKISKTPCAKLCVRTSNDVNISMLYLAMTFSGMWIGVRTNAAVRITLLKWDAHISGNKRIPLVTGGTLLAPASNVTGRTITRGLAVRTKMTRAGEPIYGRIT